MAPGDISGSYFLGARAAPEKCKEDKYPNVKNILKKKKKKKEHQRVLSTSTCETHI